MCRGCARQPEDVEEQGGAAGRALADREAADKEAVRLGLQVGERVGMRAFVGERSKLVWGPPEARQTGARYILRVADKPEVLEVYPPFKNKFPKLGIYISRTYSITLEID